MDWAFMVLPAGAAEETQLCATPTGAHHHSGHGLQLSQRIYPDAVRRFHHGHQQHLHANPAPEAALAAVKQVKTHS